MNSAYVQAQCASMTAAGPVAITVVNVDLDTTAAQLVIGVLVCHLLI